MNQPHPPQDFQYSPLKRLQGVFNRVDLIKSSVFIIFLLIMTSCSQGSKKVQEGDVKEEDSKEQFISKKVDFAERVFQNRPDDLRGLIIDKKGNMITIVFFNKNSYRINYANGKVLNEKDDAGLSNETKLKIKNQFIPLVMSEQLISVKVDTNTNYAIFTFEKSFYLKKNLSTKKRVPKHCTKFNDTWSYMM